MEYTFNGRKYRVIQDSTIEHDIETTNAFLAAGLAELKKGENEEPTAFAHRIYLRLRGTSEIFTFLGMLLIPSELADIDWTPAIGKETANRLRTVTDPKEKETIHLRILEMVSGFFSAGMLSVEISPNSLLTENHPNSENEVKKISGIGAR